MLHNSLFQITMLEHKQLGFTDPFQRDEPCGTVLLIEMKCFSRVDTLCATHILTTKASKGSDAGGEANQRVKRERGEKSDPGADRAVAYVCLAWPHSAVFQPSAALQYSGGVGEKRRGERTRTAADVLVRR